MLICQGQRDSYPSVTSVLGHSLYSLLQEPEHASSMCGEQMGGGDSPDALPRALRTRRQHFQTQHTHEREEGNQQFILHPVIATEWEHEFKI